ncbi:unnamed protein product [Plutella xylostella]|uniref:(diamondback moth) hypothetical protein n=1 Tax=Plutella xylostella TaxID=51655 RepID=A0A8S4D117_PLUXY|nr:unnamed protein product [Plutella xylostella]
MVKLTLCSTQENEDTQITTNAYVFKKLSSLLPSQEFSNDTWPTNECMKLADPQYYKPGSIDVLLGAEVHAQIILDRIKRHNSLIALNSRLGWIISGRVTPTDAQPHNIVVAHTRFEIDQFRDIKEYLPDKKSMTNKEIQCEEQHKKTHTRNTDLTQLLQLEKIPEIKDKFMNKYKEKLHTEKVPETEKERLDGRKLYYLPDLTVINTKLEVVVDRSAQPVKANSINEELLIYPPSQQDTRDLLTPIHTLHQTAHCEREEFTEKELTLETHMNRDELLMRASTVEYPVMLQKQTTQLLTRGGLPLYK